MSLINEAAKGNNQRLPAIMEHLEIGQFGIPAGFENTSKNGPHHSRRSWCGQFTEVAPDNFRVGITGNLQQCLIAESDMPFQIGFKIAFTDAFNDFAVLFLAAAFPFQLSLQFGIGGLKSFAPCSGSAAAQFPAP